MPAPMPTHVFVPQFDYPGLEGWKYQVVSTSQTPEGALYVQVFNDGYYWLKPGEYTVCEEVAA